VPKFLSYLLLFNMLFIVAVSFLLLFYWIGINFAYQINKDRYVMLVRVA
jgi:hypothetical protein